VDVSVKTRELIAFGRSLLEMSCPMTLRQLHYAIFSTARIAYENAQAATKPEPRDHLCMPLASWL